MLTTTARAMTVTPIHAAVTAGDRKPAGRDARSSTAAAFAQLLGEMPSVEPAPALIAHPRPAAPLVANAPDRADAGLAALVYQRSAIDPDNDPANPLPGFLDVDA